MQTPVPYSETGETYYEPDGLRDLIAQCEHFPGWDFELIYSREPDGSGGLMMRVTAEVVDSMNFKARRMIWHNFLVPAASYNRDTWAAWILDCLVKIATHETCEAFRIDGVREFAPHHSNGENPYMIWHVSDWATANKSSGEY